MGAESLMKLVGIRSGPVAHLELSLEIIFNTWAVVVDLKLMVPVEEEGSLVG